MNVWNDRFARLELSKNHIWSTFGSTPFYFLSVPVYVKEFFGLNLKQTKSCSTHSKLFRANLNSSFPWIFFCTCWSLLHNNNHGSCIFLAWNSIFPDLVLTLIFKFFFPQNFTLTTRKRIANPIFPLFPRNLITNFSIFVWISIW